MQLQTKLGPSSQQHSVLLSALAKPVQKVNSSQSSHLFKPMISSQSSEKKLEAIRQLFAQASQRQESSIPLPFKTHHKLNSKWSSELFSSESQPQPPVLISQDEKSICMHPNNLGYFQTHAAKFNRPLRVNAFTYWQVKLDSSACTGTSVMIGVGQRDSPLIRDGYKDLLGVDSTSWGLSIKGHTLHNGQSSTFCEALPECETNTIACLFDGYRGSLAFYVNGKFRGVAFRDMPLNKRNQAEFDLFPMISSTVANSVFSVEFAYESFPTLQELCSNVIQKEGEDCVDASFLSQSVFKRYF
jgi:hypothetical protein